MTILIKKERYITSAKMVVLSFVLLLAFIFASPASAAKGADSYVIGVEDVLTISVWENAELSVSVSVRPDGKITIPLLGDIRAKGLRPEQLKKRLEKKLASFVRTPTVTVTVSAINSFKVYVVGGGTSAQVVSLRRNTTLLQLFAHIGTLNNADIEGAFLLRGDKKVEVDLYNLVVRGDYRLDIMLKSGDMVFVPDDFETRLQVVGAVNNPQTLSYKRGLTIVDAVLLAGGFTEFADPKKVIVFRKSTDKKGNKKVEQIVVRFNDIVKKGKVEKNLILLPGDMIIVKEGLF